MKTLWLASWYPNKLSPFNGDFVKRHAEAVSLFEEVQVIHIVRDDQGIVTKNVLTEEFTQGGLTETIIYYYHPKNYFLLLDKFNAQRKYRVIYKQAIRNYLAENDTPDLVHVHIGMKAGYMGLWLKKTKGIPYVITEHWSGFLEEAREKFSDLPFYLRKPWKKIMQQAAGCSVVSEYLAKGLHKCFPGTDSIVIPNVVDTSIFFPEPGENKTVRFIHISGLDDLKNPAEILRAFKLVRQAYPESHLEIFGAERKDIVAMAADLGLQNHTHFHKEVPQRVLAKHINAAISLILYSRYETFGCVIIEANACGVPVIVSNIPVFHETVREGENGYFATPHSVEALAARMLDMIKNRSAFDSEAIVTMTGSKYSYRVVGKQFSEWYRVALKKT